MLPDDARSRAARLGTVPVRPDREADAQGEAGADRQDRGYAQGARWISGRSWKRAPRSWRRRCVRRASGRPRRCTTSFPPAAPDEVLFLLYHSALKPVQERLRNYYQKYLPAIQEITAGRMGRAGRQAGDAAPAQSARGVHRQPAGPAAASPAGGAGDAGSRGRPSPGGRARPGSRAGGSRRRQADAVGWRVPGAVYWILARGPCR